MNSALKPTLPGLDLKKLTDQNPVVLVAGYKDNASVCLRLINYLREEGFPLFPLTLSPSDGWVGLDLLSAQVAEGVEQIAQGYGSRELQFDFVGFSMGGLVLRHYLQRRDGLARANRLVTIGSPHQGTFMAYYRDRPALRQMRPGSPFLLDLNQDSQRLAQLAFTSIWTPLDLTIVPPISSVMETAQNHRVLVPYHRALITSTRVFVQVAAGLRRQAGTSAIAKSV
jgi:triacylglycerol lipase